MGLDKRRDQIFVRLATKLTAEGQISAFSTDFVKLVRTYTSTDCTGRVGEAMKRKGGVSQASLGKSSSFIIIGHSQYGQLTAEDVYGFYVQFPKTMVKNINEEGYTVK